MKNTKEKPFLNKNQEIGVMCGGLTSQTRNFKFLKDGVTFETDNAIYRIKDNGTISLHAKNSKATFHTHVEAVMEDAYNKAPDFNSDKIEKDPITPSDNDILRDIHFMVNDGMRFKRKEGGESYIEDHNMSLEEVVEEISKLTMERFRKPIPLDSWSQKHPNFKRRYILDHPDKE